MPSTAPVGEQCRCSKNTFKRLQTHLSHNGVCRMFYVTCDDPDGMMTAAGMHEMVSKDECSDDEPIVPVMACNGSNDDRKMAVMSNNNRTMTTPPRDGKNETRSARRQDPGRRRIRGVYTGVENANLFSHVMKNRCTPAAADMEEGLLSYLKSHKQCDEDRNSIHSPVRGLALSENLEPPVEATFWDEQLEHWEQLYVTCNQFSALIENIV